MSPCKPRKTRAHAWVPTYSRLVEALMMDLKVEESQSNQVLGWIRSRSTDRLLDFAKTLSPHSCIGDMDVETFVQRSQLAAFIKKVPYPGQDAKRKLKAWEKFLAGEHSCKRVNQRFRAWARRASDERPHFLLIEEIKEQIRRLIGDEPNLKRIYQSCRFGPGSAVGVSGNATHLLKKMDGLTCTPTVVEHALGAIWNNHQMRGVIREDHDPMKRCGKGNFAERLFNRLQYVSHNLIQFAPKNAEIDRTIAGEPVVNGFLQLGCDTEFKGMLLNWGIDLRSQAKNQCFAHRGSLPGTPNPDVTIDLANASNSLATQVVKLLVPPAWFAFLDSIRSPSYFLNDSDVGLHRGRYEMFSSMGNGFTFPLQTIIYAAVVRAIYRVTGDQSYTVYGDDIICRQSSALYVIEILKFLGFRTNVDKTFVHGPFRESCGEDYLGGVNVRPYNLGFLPQHWRDLIKVANGASKKGLERLKYAAIAAIPPHRRYLRPYDGPDDTAITVPIDVFMTCEFARWSMDTFDWTWKEAVSTPVLDEARSPLNNSEAKLAILGGATSQDGKPLFAKRREARTATRSTARG